MEPEERLDTLLALHTTSDWRDHGPSLVPSQNGHESLQPLLDAADRVADLRTAEPSTDFTARLETQIFALAGAVSGIESGEFLPQDYEAALRPADDSPTLPGSWRDSGPEDTTEADGVTPLWGLSNGTGASWPPGAPWRASRRRSRWRSLLWPLAAAVLLVAVIGTITLTAAASAGPGTPLYGVHRFEQGVQVSMAPSAAERTRLHIAFAQEALAALDAAATRHQTSTPYSDALATFQQEIQAATTSLDEVSAGNDRNTLSSQLGQLRAQGRADLHIALAILPWSGRVMTTAVLGDIGDPVLHVNGATMVYMENSSQDLHLWEITVTGSGFAKGAVLLVNGAPAGTVNSVTPSTLMAQMPGDDSGPLPASIGIANPDLTAAQTSRISQEQSTPNPSPVASPTCDDHGGSGHDGGGSSGSSDGGGSSSGGSGSSGSNCH
jgi:uncharacterized membrane protein YgcG